MSDNEAARALGMPRRALEYWRRSRVWRDAVRAQSIDRRHAEEPENLARAISIRDDPHVGAQAQLQAIDRIRVKDPAPAVHVDFSHHDNRQQTLVAPAGYVVNLGEPMKTIEETKKS